MNLETTIEEIRAKLVKTQETADQEKDSHNRIVDSLRANLHAQETNSSMLMNTIPDLIF